MRSGERLINLIHLSNPVVITPEDSLVVVLRILHIHSIQFRFQLIEDILERTSFVAMETDEVECVSLGVEVRTPFVGLGTIPTEDTTTRI